MKFSEFADTRIIKNIDIKLQVYNANLLMGFHNLIIHTMESEVPITGAYQKALDDSVRLEELLLEKINDPEFDKKLLVQMITAAVHDSTQTALRLAKRK